MSNSSQKIVIVGAGVFGLTTALHLARRGYTDVIVLDKSPYDSNQYNSLDGAEGASSDMNKIFRTTYGERRIYQDLALRALEVWREWTETVLNSDPVNLPANLKNTDRLLFETGFMRSGVGEEITQFFDDSLKGIEDDGRRHRAFLLNDAQELERAKNVDQETGTRLAERIELFSRIRDGDVKGFLESDGGITRADKGCIWALHLARQAGVKFILDPRAGNFDSFIEQESEDGTGRIIKGVRTKDGKEHVADKTIIACGGWTASIVPEVSRTLETTGGSLAYIQLPENRQDLWDKFAPETFGGWSFETGYGCGIGGFPRNEHGKLKFGYRKNKYTNYEAHPQTGTRISVPRTKYSNNAMNNIPLEALEELKANIRVIYPELVEFGIADTRMCWYTDTIDNHFLADYVPGTNETLFIASGGSGHGQKFLPVSSHHFVNQLEGKNDQFTEHWKWRTFNAGEKANGLEEGEAGPRVLDKAQLATEADWTF